LLLAPPPGRQLGDYELDRPDDLPTRNSFQRGQNGLVSNGPTEDLNLLVKYLKRCGQRFTSFDSYHLGVLLHTGGVSLPEPPRPLRPDAFFSLQPHRACLVWRSGRLPPADRFVGDARLSAKPSRASHILNLERLQCIRIDAVTRTGALRSPARQTNVLSRSSRAARTARTGKCPLNEAGVARVAAHANEDRTAIDVRAKRV